MDLADEKQLAVFLPKGSEKDHAPSGLKELPNAAATRDPKTGSTPLLERLRSTLEGATDIESDWRLGIWLEDLPLGVRMLIEHRAVG